MDKSHLRVGEIVLRCHITLKTLHTHKNRAAALAWCRRNGYSALDRSVVGPDNMELLEQKI